MTPAILANPDGTTALLDAAAIDPGASLSIEGSELIASNLSATSVSASAGGGVAATYAAVSDTTLDWIADFTAASINYAATLDGHDNARRYLLGLPRTVDQMETWIKGWGPANGHDFTTWQVEATFGRYGALPLVVVSVKPETATTDGFFLLVDGVNGNVDGPFELGTYASPDVLLAAHTDAYESGTPYAVTSPRTGCKELPVAGWEDSPPEGYHPRLPVPGGPVPTWPPNGPVPPAYPFNPDPTRLGWWGNYSCVSAAGFCTCESYGEEVGPNPGDPIIITRLVCTFASPGGCPAGGPAAPPGTPYPPPGSGGCTQQYWN